MRVEQRSLVGDRWIDGAPEIRANLVLVFGVGPAIANPSVRATLSKHFPDGLIVGCSTAGNIIGSRAVDDDVVVTAVQLTATRARAAMTSFDVAGGERAAGMALARQLAAPDLSHIFVLSEGIGVNGTMLVSGLREILPQIPMSGGLAGDGEAMEQTFVMLGSQVRTGAVVGVGFYGSRIRAGYGCEGGWRAFGPERRITKATGNVLLELDGESALRLYRRYLGSTADGLPASGLLFPMEIRPPAGGTATVRTVLGIEPDAGALRFAGDMPEGHYARLMTASTTNLLEGASQAAVQSMQRFGKQAGLAILVSCVGRRMVLGQRTDDELGSVGEILCSTPLTGFYSYGELSPRGAVECDLHNQTMTITTLYEDA